ncbi:MAG: hypothetical protein ABF242_01855 [Flavobacteriales bacterium]
MNPLITHFSKIKFALKYKYNKSKFIRKEYVDHHSYKMTLMSVGMQLFLPLFIIYIVVANLSTYVMEHFWTFTIIPIITLAVFFILLNRFLTKKEIKEKLNEINENLSEKELKKYVRWFQFHTLFFPFCTLVL